MALNALGLGMTFTARDLATPVMGRVRQGFTQTRAEADRFAASSRGAFGSAGGHAERFGARSRRGLGDMDQSMRKASASSGGLLAGLGGIAAGAGALLVGGAAYKAVSDFEGGLASLRALTGANKQGMDAFAEAAMQAGINTQFSPTQAIEALGDLASAGYNAKDSILMLQPTLDLAAASLGKLSPSQAAGVAAQAMHAFGIATKDAAITVDRLVQANNLFSLQGDDLALGIGAASRGAGALNQNLSETMIALGLVKTIIPRVETAATAVSVAMEKMVDPKVQAALKGMGASVLDNAGKFRPFLTIVGDMMPKLSKMKEGARAAWLQHTFGAEALGGLNAIMKAYNGGIETANGKTVKGAAAIAYLRDQFENAKGTAAKFREEMLNSFPGQMKLLKGSLETLIVAVGRPVLAVVLPLLMLVTDGVNFLITAFRKIPAPVVNSLLKVGAALGGVVFLLSGLGVAALKVLAPLGVLFASLYVAFDENIGGIGARAAGIGSQIRLAFEGVWQLFTQGGFSGKVREEFLKGESPALNFALKLWLVGHRIKNFFENIGTGFREATRAAGPVFETFGRQLDALGEALGFGGKNDPAKSASKFEAFGVAGAKVGRVLGLVGTILVTVLGAGMDLVTGFVSRFDSMGDVFAPVSEGIADVGAAFRQITTDMGLTNAGAAGTESVFGKIGSVLARVVVGALFLAGGLLKNFASIAGGLGAVVGGAVDIIAGIFAGNWTQIWLGVRKVAFGVISTIIDGMLGLVQVIADVAGAIDKATGGKLTKALGTDVSKKLREVRSDAKSFLREDVFKLDTAGLDEAAKGGSFATAKAKADYQQRLQEVQRGQLATMADAMAPKAAPAPSAAAAAGGGAGIGGLPGAMAGFAASVSAFVKPTPPPPVNATINLNLDGEQISSILARLQGSDDARAGRPQPVGG